LAISLFWLSIKSVTFDLRFFNSAKLRFLSIKISFSYIDAPLYSNWSVIYSSSVNYWIYSSVYCETDLSRSFKLISPCLTILSHSYRNRKYKVSSNPNFCFLSIMILCNPTQVSSSYKASYLLSSIKAYIRCFSSILSVACNLSSSFCESNNLRNFRFSFFSSSRLRTYYERFDTSSEYCCNFFLN